MLNLNSVMIGTANAKKLIAFYSKILNKDPDMLEGEWAGWVLGNGFLSVGQHSEVKGVSSQPARVMFNLETNEVKEEYERIKKAGAKTVKEPYQMQESWIATLSDPDGNYFQLMSPWK